MRAALIDSQGNVARIADIHPSIGFQDGLKVVFTSDPAVQVGWMYIDEILQPTPLVVRKSRAVELLSSDLPDWDTGWGFALPVAAATLSELNQQLLVLWMAEATEAQPAGQTEAFILAGSLTPALSLIEWTKIALNFGAAVKADLKHRIEVARTIESAKDQAAIDAALETAKETPPERDPKKPPTAKDAVAKEVRAR